VFGSLGGGGGAPAIVSSRRCARTWGTVLGPEGRNSVAVSWPPGLTSNLISYGISSSDRCASGGGGLAGGGSFGLLSGLRFGLML